MGHRSLVTRLAGCGDGYAAEEEHARELALAEPNVQKHMAGKTPKRIIYVRGRIANLIVG